MKLIPRHIATANGIAVPVVIRTLYLSVPGSAYLLASAIPHFEKGSPRAITISRIYAISMSNRTAGHITVPKLKICATMDRMTASSRLYIRFMTRISLNCLFILPSLVDSFRFINYKKSLTVGPVLFFTQVSVCGLFCADWRWAFHL